MEHIWQMLEETIPWQVEVWMKQGRVRAYVYSRCSAFWFSYVQGHMSHMYQEPLWPRMGIRRHRGFIPWCNSSPALLDAGTTSGLLGIQTHSLSKRFRRTDSPFKPKSIAFWKRAPPAIIHRNAGPSTYAVRLLTCQGIRHTCDRKAWHS